MPKQRRQKISTTIAPENSAFLKRLIKRGKAANLAEAVDSAISLARRTESSNQREAAWEAYYASLDEAALREEQELERAVAHSASLVDFDGA